jgi:hypothetical protein
MSALEIIITRWLATLLETKFILAGMRIAKQAYGKLASERALQWSAPTNNFQRPLFAGAVGGLGHFTQNEESIVGRFERYP